MSTKNSAQSGFLNKLFSKNSSHSNVKTKHTTDNEPSEKISTKKKQQPLTKLLELYDKFGNNYSYFKSLCLESNDRNSGGSVLNGVQGLKSLITELKYEVQTLQKKYPHLVIVADPDRDCSDDIKVFNSLCIIITKSEAVLEHVKAIGLEKYGSPDVASANRLYINTNQSSSNSLHQNKMFPKRVKRSMRDHSDTRNALNTQSHQLTNANGSGSSVPTYQVQKQMERAREEKRTQRLQKKKSYSNTSIDSLNGRKSYDSDVNLTDLESPVASTLDPFADFANNSYPKPERKSLSRKQSSNKLQPTVSNGNGKKNASSKSINVSLQAAALAAQSAAPGSTLKPPMKKFQSAAAIKPAPSPKRITITDSGSQTDISEPNSRSQKDILEDEILKGTPQIDYKMGKQIFQEILVSRSSQRPLQWDDIIGLDNCKQQLQETIVFPFLRPDLFFGLREPINGLLLYGPPGTGKTMLAKCVAYQTESTFFNVSVSSITSKFLGESEKLVKGLFTLAAKLSPSIIFIDEIDSILGSRGSSSSGGGDDSGAAGESSRRFKNEFLTQWSNLSYSLGDDGSFNRVLVLGCTNLPWIIDDAARRRFQKRIYCPLPNFQDRIDLIQMLLSKNDEKVKAFTAKELEELSNLTDGFSNSDLLNLCKDASMEPIRELIRKGDNSILNVEKHNIRSVDLEDFKTSINANKIKGSVNLDTLHMYETWTEQFGS